MFDPVKLFLTIQLLIALIESAKHWHTLIYMGLLKHFRLEMSISLSLSDNYTIQPETVSGPSILSDKDRPFATIPCDISVLNVTLATPTVLRLNPKGRREQNTPASSLKTHINNHRYTLTNAHSQIHTHKYTLTHWKGSMIRII